MRKLIPVLFLLIATLLPAQELFESLHAKARQDVLDNYFILKTILFMELGLTPRVVTVSEGNIRLYSDGSIILALKGTKFLIVPYSVDGTALLLKLLDDDPIRVDKSFQPQFISI